MGKCKPRGEVNARNVSLETPWQIYIINSAVKTRLFCCMELGLIRPLETTQIFRLGVM